jgi:alcohol dehydrogenase
VALYDKPQVLPLPDMYGKNLTFKTGGVDGCDCAEILSQIKEAYRLFEDKADGVIKVAITNG